VDGRTWGFDRRAYYPPPDPINAMLSFGYTLLLNDLIAACQLAGLDPCLGFFHAIDYNKPAMALDLEEEFRPILVDTLILTAANRPLFRLQDFEVSQPGANHKQEDDEDEVVTDKGSDTQPQKRVNPIHLTEAARKRFISLYEGRVQEQIFYPPTQEKTSYRRIFELQAYQMARLILGESDQYPPFGVR
jgi:CRISPR-associated protein Cas1